MGDRVNDGSRFFDLSRDMLCTAGFDGYFKELNPEWERALGFTLEELRAQPYIELVHADDRAPTLAEAAKLASGIETDLLREPVPVQGRFLSVVALERRHERRGRADLRGRQGHHRAEAIRVGARRARANRAIEASRLKSEFISRMSHELRTPLTAILGFGELLEDGELDDDQRESVARITNAGRHLLQMINDLLDVSAIEAGRLRLSVEIVHVDDVVAEVLAMIAPIAAASGVTLGETIVTTGESHVLADRQRLKQVVLNLVANAVKYNRRGGEVCVTADQIGGRRLRLAISDTGLGIADEDLDRLFQPFERFGTKQTDVEGSGLGLALTKSLVNAMGGNVGAESRIGLGSRFWIDLRLGDAPPRAGRAASFASSGADERDPSPRTVLYVDDNLVNVALLERILQRRPEVTLLTATDGRTGLELARVHQPALVLLDLNLPEMSGQEVLLRLRAEPETAAIPVVIVSGDASPANVDALKAAGATDYLTKPYHVKQVLAVIDKTAPSVARP